MSEEFAKALIDAYSRGIVAINDPVPEHLAGLLAVARVALEQAAQWHDEQARDEIKYDGFLSVVRFHEKCASAIRALIPKDTTDGH